MRIRLTTPKSTLVFALLTGITLWSTTASWGGVKETLTLRRALGLASLGGGVALAVKGFEYRDDADGFYDAYQVAKDPVEIDRLYQRSTNRDVKSQVSWALAGALGPRNRGGRTAGRDLRQLGGAAAALGGESDHP